ncbi:MAG TPA: ABC transporter substrate-binding protein [Anaerolineales bacterium]|nr:ABC transporter substrate-binding protein [Anaerolineales bacterium]
MKTVRSILFALIAIVLIASIVGCQPKPAAGPATIHVLAMEQAGPTVDEMNAIVGEFNKANPDIKVEIEYVAYDALHDKITTAMASNPPAYDVFLVDDIWYAEFAKAGYVLDVTDRVSKETHDKIFPAAWDITTVNGKIYGMPWLLDEKYFYYNEDMLKQAGFDAPPATWEELLSQAKVLKDKGIVEYPLVWSWGQAEAAICDWVVLLYGNGGSLVDDKGAPAFNNDIGVKTLEWMVKTIDDGYTNPSSISYVEEDVRNVFSQGKAAFALNWVYMYDLVNLQKDQSQVAGKIKMALIPAFEGSSVQSASINGSMGFSVAATSPNKDAAWKYIEFLTSEPIQNKYSAHLLPMWQTSFEGENLTQLEGYNAANAVTVPMFNEQFQYAHVRPKVPYYPEASKALQLALQEALTKQKTPKQALDDAAAKWVELAK